MCTGTLNEPRSPARRREVADETVERKLFGLFREHRHEPLDDAFREPLDAMYRETGAGKRGARLCRVLVRGEARASSPLERERRSRDML